MEIGIPKEIKVNENRVGITPTGVQLLLAAGHHVIVEREAGSVAGYSDAAYVEAGATMADAETAWAAELVIKVKEPLASEYHYLRPDLVLYTYLHLAANAELTAALIEHGTTAIGYETMTAADGSLPALTPMSQVAGRMAVLIGGQFLQTQFGGKGLLLTGVPGIRKANVVVIGGGVVGQNAVKVALGLGANVTLLDIAPHVLAKVDDEFGGRVQTLFSTSASIAAAVKTADLVIGAVLITGARAPKLVTEEMIASMAPGSVVVDIPIDQGGIFATSTHATTFDDPTYVVDGVIHYAVANLPGAVPKTATDALTSVTIPFAKTLAGGVKPALQASRDLFSGVNVYQGTLVNQAVATSLDLTAKNLAELL
ncbi:alanine dehydrogenase [Lacticaseibacillus yichunensis]|uniref:Alanine dehydrogenase n=1 Tax=Lacticaseibacillus yichunensis TaxID=2486015 RepID=A0ABW4CN32_9LACO|nr:alanine dehydrogenase [Lacticaseibacillus yichunensis]